MKAKKYFIILLALLFITTGAKCGSLPAGLTPGKPEAITLNYWKVWDEQSNFAEIISAYQILHPNVTVKFRNFTYQEFESELLNALAEDRGPDIFSIHTTWTRNYKNKIASMPATVKIPYQVERGSIKKEVYTEVRDQATLSLKEMKTLYPDVVYDNQVIDDQVYGLPLSIDTMALFYNRDLLNNAGIATPPQNWDQFQEQVIKLTKLSPKGEIIQSGAAIGTADNITRSPDLISLLMMQNGAQMTNANGNATFQIVPQQFKGSVNPSVQALDFYVSFASPTKQVYTWNNQMDNALLAFMQGKTAFYFGYAYDIATIKAQAPKLNFEIAPMPQTSNNVNFASYWVETVSNKSQHIDQAWDFINFMTGKEENAKKYLDKAKLPTALRSLIDDQSGDVYLQPFVSQLLTAKSWYKGLKAQSADTILKDMINNALLGIEPTEDIVKKTVTRINQETY